MFLPYFLSKYTNRENLGIKSLYFSSIQYYQFMCQKWKVCSSKNMVHSSSFHYNFPIFDQRLWKHFEIIILDAQNFLKGFGSFVWNGLFIPLLCKPLLIYLDKKTQLSKLCVGKSSQVKSSRHKQANIDMFVCLTCFSSRASFLPFYFFTLSRICVSTKKGYFVTKIVLTNCEKKIDTNATW